MHREKCESTTQVTVSVTLVMTSSPHKNTDGLSDFPQRTAACNFVVGSNWWESENECPDLPIKAYSQPGTHTYFTQKWKKKRKKKKKAMCIIYRSFESLTGEILILGIVSSILEPDCGQDTEHYLTFSYCPIARLMISRLYTPACACMYSSSCEI